jgi:hypothetical protein
LFGSEKESVFGRLCLCGHYGSEHILEGFMKPKHEWTMDGQMEPDPLDVKRGACNKCQCKTYGFKK